MVVNKKLRSNLITYSDSNSIISDQYRTIRTNIKFLPGERENRIYLITSPGKKEGKSTTTANLAVSMAQQRERILLIDTNLKEPVIHDIFNIPNNYGLTDILTAKAKFDEVIYKTDIGKLDILTTGSTLFNPAELLGNKAMTDLLTEVASLYSMVLIDAPTVLKSTETRVLANQCDGVILVLQRGKTVLEKSIEARRILELAHAKLAGVIINEK